MSGIAGVEESAAPARSLVSVGGDGTFRAPEPGSAALEDALGESGKNHTTHQLQQIVRRTVGSWVSRKLRRKPMIVPVVVEA